jgi:hypothetical protein
MGSGINAQVMIDKMFSLINHQDLLHGLKVEYDSILALLALYHRCGGLVLSNVRTVILFRWDSFEYEHLAAENRYRLFGRYIASLLRPGEYKRNR